MWFVFAILSSIFAVTTSIFSKICIDGLNSTLPTAVRTVAVLIMSWVMVFATRPQKGANFINKKSWMFLILSGLATGMLWLCYCKAIQLGVVSKTVPVDKLGTVITIILAVLLLHEKFTYKTIIGSILVTIGILIVVF